MQDLLDRLERLAAGQHLVEPVARLDAGCGRRSAGPGRRPRARCRRRPRPARRSPRPFRPRLAPSGRTCVTLRRSVATICSAVAAPTPGSVVSHLASWRWMASAISLIGRTSALIALRVPTLSTVQNSSKNSSSASLSEADQPRHDPALHRVAVEVLAGVQRDLLADARPAGCRRTNSGTSTWYSSGPDLQADLLVEDAVEHAGDLGNHGLLSSAAAAVLLQA